MNDSLIPLISKRSHYPSMAPLPSPLPRPSGYYFTDSNNFGSSNSRLKQLWFLNLTKTRITQLPKKQSSLRSTQGGSLNCLSLSAFRYLNLPLWLEVQTPQSSRCAYFLLSTHLNKLTKPYKALSNNLQAGLSNNFSHYCSKSNKALTVRVTNYQCF